MENEIWLAVVGFEGEYQVSNLGRVKSVKCCNGLKRNPIRTLYKTIWGYVGAKLYRNKKQKRYSIHRLVAKAFIPNPENKPCVNHKNGIKTDNRVENLEWVTYSENEIHSIHVLGKKTTFQPMLGKFGKDHNRSKGVKQLTLSGVLITTYGSQWEAYRATGISQGNIASCARGKRKKAGGFLWQRS